jgi:hypothetical protein
LAKQLGKFAALFELFNAHAENTSYKRRKRGRAKGAVTARWLNS